MEVTDPIASGNTYVEEHISVETHVHRRHRHRGTCPSTPGQ